MYGYRPAPLARPSLVEKVCKRCGRFFETRARNTDFCDYKDRPYEESCREIHDRERRAKYDREYRRKNKFPQERKQHR